MRTTGPPSVPAARGRADRLVIGGGLTFLTGAVALAAVLALLARRGDAPDWLAAVTLLCPAGFLVWFGGLVGQALRRRARPPAGRPDPGPTGG